MPKKRKSKKKIKKIKEISKKQKIKEIKKELESEITEESFERNSQEFSPVQRISPVLEQVADAPEPRNLEQNISQTPTQTKEEEKKATNYTTQRLDYETKTSEHSEDYVMQPETIDVETPTTRQTSVRRINFHNPELEQIREKDPETEYVARPQTLERDNARLPFEQKQSELGKYKFKNPESNR